MMKKMNKIIITILCVCVIGIAEGKDDKIKVNFTTDELIFSINILNTIDLAGDEVTPFMDIKNLLMDVYKDVNSGKKKSADVDFTKKTANNFLFFIHKAKLKGAEAALFINITNKVVEAIKKME